MEKVIILLSDPKFMFFTTLSHVWTQHKILLTVAFNLGELFVAIS